MLFWCPSHHFKLKSTSRTCANCRWINYVWLGNLEFQLFFVLNFLHKADRRIYIIHLNKNNFKDNVGIMRSKVFMTTGEVDIISFFLIVSSRYDSRYKYSIILITVTGTISRKLSRSNTPNTWMFYDVISWLGFP